MAWAFIWIACGLGLSAQTVRDHVLPPGMPRVIEGPVFTTEQAMAVHGDGAIFAWRGLNLQATTQRLDPAGPLRMAAPWRRLSSERAVYRAVGLDGSAGTPDDELVLVIDLPDRPQLVPTGVLADTDPIYKPFSNEWAFSVSAAGDSLLLLHHDRLGISISSFTPSLRPGTSNAAHEWVVTDAGTLMTLAPGVDGLRGTSDDQILAIVEAGQVGASPRLLRRPMPNGFVPSGCIALESGTLVVHGSSALPTVEFLCVTEQGGSIAIHAAAHTFPLTAMPGYPHRITVEAGFGDAFTAQVTDDGPQTHTALFTDAGKSARLLATWNDYASRTEIVGPTQVMRTYPQRSAGFDYYDFAQSSLPLASNQQRWSEAPLFTMPANGSVVAFLSERGGPRSHGVDMAHIATVHGLDAGSGVDAMDSRTGSWTGDGYGALTGNWQPVPIAKLGAGRVAGFVSAFGDSAPEILRVVTVPSRSKVAFGRRRGANARVQVDMPGLLPGEAPAGGSGLAIENGPGMLSMAFAFVATKRFAAPEILGAPFAADAQLHLDPTSIVMAPYVASTLNAVDLPFRVGELARFQLAGTPLFLQAAAPDDTGSWHMSDCLQFVLR